MATPGVSFASQIDDWVRATKGRQRAVFLTSAENVMERAVTGAPVDTGFLRAAYVVTVNGALPPANQENAGQNPSPPPIAASLAGADIGDFVTIGFTAVYGPRVHWGFVGTDSAGREINQAGNPWILRAAAAWPEIVREATAAAKATVAARSQPGR